MNQVNIDVVRNNGLAIVSEARKLLFKVPEKGATNILAPENYELDEYSQAREGVGIVVYNGTNDTYQGADVSGYVIVNEVPSKIAEAALNGYDADRSVQNLKQVLKKLATTEVEGRNLHDQYTTPADFYESQLSPAGMMLDDGSGIMKRDSRDTAYVVKHGKKLITAVPEGRELVLRDIEPEIIIRTYVQHDGSAISIDKIPVLN